MRKRWGMLAIALVTAALVTGWRARPTDERAEEVAAPPVAVPVRRAERPRPPPAVEHGEVSPPAEAPPSVLAQVELPEDDPQEWLARAETAFEAGELLSATGWFQRIVDETPDARAAPYALYKLAWCEWNLGRTDEAIRDMEMLLDWVEAGDVPVPDVIRAEAEKDLERFRTE